MLDDIYAKNRVKCDSGDECPRKYTSHRLINREGMRPVPSEAHGISPFAAVKLLSSKRIKLTGGNKRLFENFLTFGGDNK